MDAGCGIGAFSFLAADAGNYVLGLTFDQEQMSMAETCRDILRLNAGFKHVDLRVLETIGLTPTTFDQIICCEVIEHLLDDDKLIRNLVDRLSPGGTLLLTTPDIDANRLFGASLSKEEDGGHVRWGYSQRDLKLRLEKAGLTVREASTIGGYLCQKLMNVCLRFFSKRPSAMRMINGAYLLLRPIDLLVTRLIGYRCVSIAMVVERGDEKVLTNEGPV